MWSKQKHIMKPHLEVTKKPVYIDSWEEQAFAEDSAGPLGGCIWPPRSYSCSFCRREFRSAQALGGHMNVHRRDRALLKQSLSPQNEIPQYPSQICSKVFNPKPDSLAAVFASPPPASRVSSPPSRANYTFVPLFSSPVIKEYHNKTSKFSPSPWSNLVADKYFHVTGPNDKKKSSKFLGSNVRAKEDCVTADLSASLNLAVRRNRPTSFRGEEEEEYSMSCKKPKTDLWPLQSFLETKSSEGHHLQSEIVELSSSSIEEDLDLELRLGNWPEVK